MIFKNWNHFPINKICTPFFFTDIDNLLYPAQNVHTIFFQDNDCKYVYLFLIFEPCDSTW